MVDAVLAGADRSESIHVRIIRVTPRPSRRARAHTRQIHWRCLCFLFLSFPTVQAVAAAARAHEADARYTLPLFVSPFSLSFPTVQAVVARVRRMRREEGDLGRFPDRESWRLTFDKASGARYWFNTRTGTTAWAPPQAVGVWWTMCARCPYVVSSQFSGTIVFVVAPL